MSSKPKILVISSRAGTGHIRAAQAICDYGNGDPSSAYRYEHINLEQYTGLLTRLICMRGYETSLRHAPWFYKQLWYITNKKLGQKLLAVTAPLLRWNARRLVAYVQASPPDRIICTHFIPPFILAGKTGAPIDVVITDYCAHSAWHAPGVRYFFVANEASRQQLPDPRRAIVSGLPVHPDFCQEKNIPVLQKKLGLNPEFPTILILAGGSGAVDISATATKLIAALPKSNIVAIPGRSGALGFKKLATLQAAYTYVQVHETVKNMNQWMALADIIITKPGGMTTAEALYLQKPLILTNPIPGQEDANAAYLVEKKYAVFAATPAQAASLTKDILAGRIKLERAQIACANEIILQERE